MARLVPTITAGSFVLLLAGCATDDPSLMTSASAPPAPVATARAPTDPAATASTRPNAVAKTRARPAETSSVPQRPRRVVRLEGAHGPGSRTVATRSVPTVRTRSVSVRSVQQASSRASRVEETDEFEVVPILWATNRVVRPSRSVGKGSNYRPYIFVNQRSRELTKGVARITVPKIKRSVGTVPRPVDVTLLTVTLYKEEEDPRKHFTIGELKRLNDNDFLSLAARISSSSQTFKGHCLLYVHGYRNSFSDAIYRAAQLAVDLSFDGPTLAFSWPSQGKLTGYIADRDHVDASVLQFKNFLLEFGTKGNCKQLHIIAHSMGTRLVVDTFFPSTGGRPMQSLQSIGQIILASPDIDAGVLRARAGVIGSSARTVTLYANGHDDALKWSKRAASGFQRAGDVIDGKPVVIPGVDTIDLTPMSKATWVFVGANHSEYAERAHVLNDIALLIRHGVRPPEKRFAVYKPQHHHDGTFWRYVPN